MKKFIIIALIIISLYLIYLNFFKKEQNTETPRESRDIVKASIDTIKQDGEKKIYTYSFNINGKKKMGIIVLTQYDDLKIEDFMVDSQHINVGVVLRGQEVISHLALVKE